MFADLLSEKYEQVGRPKIASRRQEYAEKEMVQIIWQALKSEESGADFLLKVSE